jgi:hypothetical protein
MQENKRISNPTEVVLYPGVPFPTKAYWVEVPTTDLQGTAFVKAKVDRATNTITVEGEGITKVTLYFNDVLVDQEKTIKVICNGAENQNTAPPSLNLMLDFVYLGRCDPGRLYTNKKQYDLPPKPKEKTPKDKDGKAGEPGKPGEPGKDGKDGKDGQGGQPPKDAQPPKKEGQPAKDPVKETPVKDPQDKAPK